MEYGMETAIDKMSYKEIMELVQGHLCIQNHFLIYL
jgi:hypothetical protein